MHIEDQAILNTWIYYLDSLKFDPPLSLCPLSYDRKADWCITGINENLYNSVFVKCADNWIKLCEELRNCQRQLNLPLTAWVSAETCATAVPILAQYFHSPGSFSGMLLNLMEAKIISVPEHITIEPVQNSDDIQMYARLYSTIFNFPNMYDPTIRWLEQTSHGKNSNILSYIARIDGTVAGICSLIINNQFNAFKTGGLYNAGVLPKFRNKGIGTAMACHRVKVAKEKQLRNLSILLMSDAMARGYCEKLGFRNYSPLIPFYIK